MHMKKFMALLLSLVLTLSLAVPAAAAGEQGGSFVLAVVTANSVVIEPELVPYTAGQSVRDALLATDHDFVGLEQGFIYEVDGTVANFSLFYDGNGFNLDVDAGGITALCVGVSSQYSEELLQLMVRMAHYRTMGGAQKYAAAAEAYEAGLAVIRGGSGSDVKAVLEQLNNALEDYEALMNGEKFTVTVTAKQGDAVLTAPVVRLTDMFGNETSVTGTSVQVVAGSYSFSVSDGGHNRTEGTVNVEGDTALAVELPAGEWFGAVKILDAAKQPYPYTQDTQNHTAVFRIPDTAKSLGSLYLNVEQGAVPDENTTRLKTVYTGLNGQDYSELNRSWESVATALINLVEPGMAGREFALEARYADEAGYVQIQSYAVTILRTPTLKSLTVTAEGTVLPLTFDPVTYSYALSTVSGNLEVAAEGFGGDYGIAGTGTVAVSGTGGTHTVSVSAGGTTTDYVLNLTKSDSVAVRLNVPDAVTAQVYNAADSLIAPVDGVYHLIPGEEYTCLATKNTHYHTKVSFVAAEGLTVSVTAPVVEDWLEDLALYSGSNAATRTPYESDKAFSSGEHAYTYTVSDCNTAVYAQATSEYTVTAYYSTQTTSTATNGTARTVAVDKSVRADGSTRILPQVIARSGFGNTVTLRVSRRDAEVTWYQDYTVTLARKLHLYSLVVSASDGELVLQGSDGSTVSFDRDMTCYTVQVNRDEEALYLTGTFPNAGGDTDCCGGYYAMIGGLRYDTLDNTPVPLDTERYSETVEVEICHADTGSLATAYTIQVCKTDPVKITIDTDPEDAVVFLTNTLNGKRILGKEGVYSLTPGGSYDYTVTCAGYVGTSGSYTAPDADGTLEIRLEKAPQNEALQQLESSWPHLRHNDENNGVIDAPVPVKDTEAALYWATKIGDGFDSNACGCPILVDGYLYTYAGTTIYKVDTLSGEIVATGQMDHASSYAINPPTYAEGKLFIGLADGSVQAFNASTLESLWLYRDPLGGQPNCSIIYHDGYVYTGFWVGETSRANYVCLNATDEDPTQAKEGKLATWHHTSVGGYYWGGAYVCDDYLLIGTDDGASGYTSGKASLLSFDPRTGVMLDEWAMDVVGDIRSSITCYNGRYYFTNKGGYFFEAQIDSDGTIVSVKKLKLSNGSNNDATPAMSTCTPVIYNGRAYVGVSGSSQFGAYSGHNITVIDISNWEIAYSVPTQGYPQTSGVLTTAWEEETGKVYVYFFDNYTPGKLRALEDKPGQTRATLVSAESYTDKGTAKNYNTAYALFTPVGDQAQYAICSPIIDEYGTVYFKNDSAYLMAVGSTVETLEITRMPDKLTYRVDEAFDGTGMQVTAHYTNGMTRDVTDYITWPETPLTEADTDFVVELPYMMYQNAQGQAGVKCDKPFAAISLTIELELAPGDVNGDKAVDMEDVSEVLKHINGSIRLEGGRFEAADVSGDNAVSMKDVSLLLQYIKGSIAQFPVQEE